MSLTLALTGDSMIVRGALAYADKQSRALQEIIRSADVSFTNLEVVANDYQGYHGSGTLTPTLAAPASVLDELAEFGIDVVAFANNHALNLGIEGMLSAIRELKARRLAYCGVGRTLAEASAPVYIDRPGGSVAFLSCATTFAPGEEATPPSELMPGRPGLNPMRYRTRMGVTRRQLDVLAEIHQQLGLDEDLAYLAEMRFLNSPATAEDKALFGSTFFAADQPHIATSCHEPDLDRICRWVGEASARADVTVVSVHSHERGRTPLDPAEFLIDFAHAVIDAGADVVAGNGPHCLRGIEMYHGRPIFFSLGNFVAQFELQTIVSSHTYDVFGASPELTAHQIIGGDLLGFATHPEYARAAVPVLRFAGGALKALELYPTTLGQQLPAAQRGRPALATGGEAEVILSDMATLSAKYGTSVTSSGGMARITVP
jgi:poly-gamma-glutamate capsule biosynthesis protein CapA/YwtB (metallophosphatase superfamily)